MLQIVSKIRTASASKFNKTGKSTKSDNPALLISFI